MESTLSNLLEAVKNRIPHDLVHYKKAVTDFSTKCESLLHGSDTMIQKALQNFGKDSFNARSYGKRKNSGYIPVQNKSVARRKYKSRGRGSSQKRRPTKDLPKTSSCIDDEVCHALPKQKKQNAKRPHDLTKIVALNVPSDKKH